MLTINSKHEDRITTWLRQTAKKKLEKWSFSSPQNPKIKNVFCTFFCCIPTKKPIGQTDRLV